MPASLGINRNLSTISISAAATVGPDVDQVIADATSAGFTLTLTDFTDGAKHQLEVLISPSDTSGNDVTIIGNAGAFTATVSSDGATSVLLETQFGGTWFVVADVSSTDAAGPTLVLFRQERRHPPLTQKLSVTACLFPR